MSLSKLPNTFVIFFSNLPNIEGKKRLVRIRQFVDNGLGDKIEVLENFIFPIKFQYSAIITVKAENLKAVETALEPANGEFKISVFQPDIHQRNNVTNHFNCCILTSNLENSNIEALSEGNMDVHSVIKLPESTIYKQLLLVNTNQMVDVFRYSEKHLANSHPYISQVISISEYLENSLQKSTNEVSEAATNSINPQVAGEGHILNQGTNTVYYADTDDTNPNLYDLLKNSRKPIISTGNQPVQSNVHFWETLGGNFSYTLKVIRGLGAYRYIPLNISTEAPIPSKVNSVAKGELLAFNLPSNETFHTVTEVGTWLNDLYNTDKYDAPWPESIYTGDKQIAYKKIIELLVKSGVTSLPREGGFTSSQLDRWVKFPTDGSINEEAFNAVMDDLGNECDFIRGQAEEWFGGGGYFQSLTNTDAVFAQIGIDRAVELMKLPAHTSEITVILDAIFGELISLISLIPEVGSMLSTVLRLAWSTAKKSMEPGKPVQPIHTIVADLEKDLGDYLKFIKDSNSAHLGIITGNWGKLKEFSLGAINLIKINPEMFSLKTKVEGVDVLPPSVYLDAIDNAWRIISYKALYPGKFTMYNKLIFLKDKPTPIFDRENRKYFFSYYLRCKYEDNSQNKFERWAEMTYTNDLPLEVLDDLFNKENLNLNPIEFYLGYNGWASKAPEFYTGMDFWTPIDKLYL
ncbi:MAG: hypothetical protein KUG68_08845 [Flavobacteriaceae bacterium]|nr:hypothetical protein [Flavobacteriaceae bacterium]